MKTQHQLKTLAPKETLFDTEKTARQLKSDADVIAFDEESSFDSHWTYSYIMDYILAHRKEKKRKS